MTTTEKSTTQMFTELVDNLKGLTRERVAAVKAERHHEKEKLRQARIHIGVAAGLTLVGALLAVETVALVLVAVGLAPWLAHAIVAVIALGIGGILLKQMPDTTEMDTMPESTIKRIGEDFKEIAVEVKHDVNDAVHAVRR